MSFLLTPWCFHCKTAAGWICVTVSALFRPPATTSLPIFLCRFFCLYPSLPHRLRPPPPPNSLFHQCLDGSAFSIIYRAFKSLTSCAVCKSPGLVCAQQLTLWIKQRWYATCDRKGFSKMGRELGSKRKKNKKRSHSPPQS